MYSTKEVIEMSLFRAKRRQNEIGKMMGWSEQQTYAKKVSGAIKANELLYILNEIGVSLSVRLRNVQISTDDSDCESAEDIIGKCAAGMNMSFLLISKALGMRGEKQLTDKI